jgi:hypothetical protein
MVFSLSLSLVVVGGFGMRRDLCWSVGGESTNLDVDALGDLSCFYFFSFFLLSFLFLFSFARGWVLLAGGMNLYFREGGFGCSIPLFCFVLFCFLLLYFFCLLQRSLWFVGTYLIIHETCSCIRSS